MIDTNDQHYQQVLFDEWLRAKRNLAEAKRRLDAAREAVLTIVPTPEEGRKTHNCLGKYKVVVGQPVYRKVDEEQWHIVKDLIDESFHPVRSKLEVDTTGAKWLAENRPADWRAVASAFTTRPGTPSVSITRIP